MFLVLAGVASGEVRGEEQEAVVWHEQNQEARDD